MHLADLKQRRFWEKTAIVALALATPLILFNSFGILEAFELQLMDFMTLERGERQPNSEIVLVTIDDQTVAELGSPLPRKYIAEAMRVLHDYGARAVAVDLLFMEEREPQADSQLAQIAKDSGNMIHSFHFTGTWEEAAPEEFDQAPADSLYKRFGSPPRAQAKLQFPWGDTPKLPHARFMPSFEAAGHISVYEDPDGRFRRIPLFYNYRDRVYPSLSLATFCEYLGIPVDSLRSEGNFWGYKLVARTPNGHYEIPINRKGEVLLNFYGSFNTFKSYSVAELLHGLQDLQERKAPRVPFNDFAGKIVFIGNVETGLQDVVVTPFSGNFPGVGFQATAVSNFLEGNNLKLLPWYVDAGIILLIGLLYGLGLFWRNRLNHGRLAFFSWLAPVLLLLTFNLFAYFVLFKGMHVAPALLQINATLILLFFSTSFYEKAESVKVLNREVKKLKVEMQEKRAVLTLINDRITSRDEQYKTMEFFTQEIENIIKNNPANGSSPLSPLLEKLVTNQKLIKAQLDNDLTRLRTEKTKLEEEKEYLETQIATYTGREPVASMPVPNEENALPVEPLERTYEVAKQALESYKAFVRKEKKNYYVEPVSGIVTAFSPERSNSSNPGKMQEIIAQITRFSAFDATVLITGESGTGKELVAEALHQQSPRKSAPFVRKNCAAIPEQLIESELFGADKGAFTGSVKNLIGAFEQANGGSIFLDEIGEFKYDIQAKLLRVLEDRKVTPLGANNREIPVDVRIVAATNRDLQKFIREGRFHEDLYFRLNQILIHLPPLRERKEDIPHLVHRFLEQFNQQHNMARNLTEEALLAMICYHWPGNIRVLKNVVERLCMEAQNDTITLNDLPSEIKQVYLAATTPLPRWDMLVSEIQTEMQSLLQWCRDRLSNGHVESGSLRVLESNHAHCYDYIKGFINSKDSRSHNEKRENLARQTIVAMREELWAWCKAEKLARMEQMTPAIESLLGRSRKMIDIWKQKHGFPPFYV